MPMPKRCSTWKTNQKRCSFFRPMQEVGAVFQLAAAAGLETAFMVLDRAAARPMAVLLDFNLGRFKGTDLLRWMRGRPEYSQTEVAVFSGLDSERQVTESYDAGADYYLTKPAAFESLIDIVDRINRGFLRPSKNLFLYPLVTSPAYRPPLGVAGIYDELRRREHN
jgi:DNA-binding NarL/FixJ family response regulator